MKVWIAISMDGYSSSTINGVFLSKERAEELRAALPKGYERSDCCIEEHEVLDGTQERI